LLSKGEATPPCGTPATTLSNTPSTSTPAVSIDLIKLNTLPSATRSATRSISRSCESDPKKSEMSPSTIHSARPSCRQIRRIALCVERPGR